MEKSDESQLVLLVADRLCRLYLESMLCRLLSFPRRDLIGGLMTSYSMSHDEAGDGEAD